MTSCFFASDLHGSIPRYEKLWRAIEVDRPAAVFLGGDLLPSGLTGLASSAPAHLDFVNDVMRAGFDRVRDRLGRRYPKVFLVLGNDDGRFEEAAILDAAASEVWVYAHNRSLSWSGYRIFGYNFVPPTPFRWKDWERYDVSRHVPPGCISPEDGRHSLPTAPDEIKYRTIGTDLESLVADFDLTNALMLFHTPPHETKLDRAANDGKMVDWVPLDLHVGSIAVRRLIESRQPLVTLHGHIHESARLTGSWRDRIGRTHLFGGAHDGDELALVRFDAEQPSNAIRQLL
ncbi:MAG TPA: metallophosphoesterase [Candidatus Polarisedimenticolaceae bacterium]|nr:metallophosphoesterase [Candidatus Polarisedimenticolaceae bacterium]